MDGSSKPIIIFSDIHMSQLKALVCFMYHGEVNIPRSSLGKFLSAAEKLKINGVNENLTMLLENEQPNLEKNDLHPVPIVKKRKIVKDFFEDTNENTLSVTLDHVRALYSLLSIHYSRNSQMKLCL